MLPAAFAPDTLDSEAAFEHDTLGGDVAIGAVTLDAVDIQVIEAPADNRAGEDIGAASVGEQLLSQAADLALRQFITLSK
jgi:hypothetical protein